MRIDWNDLLLPDFGPPTERPELPAELYAERCRRAYSLAGVDWLVVYGDREHYANLAYLTGYDPRFEEGILLLGAHDRRLLLVGNEGLDYASLLTLPLEIILCQSLSLPGQDRSQAPRLADVLCAAGLAGGECIGVVGWKYLEPDEWTGQLPGIFAPAMLVDTLRDLAGDPAAVSDRTPVLLSPADGLRARAEVEQIALFEWAASRATAAVGRIVRGTRPEMTEYEAAARLEYAGDPMSTHLLFASGRGPIVGLRSPSTRVITRGDGVTAAVGYWGGLCARAGIVDDFDDQFVQEIAIPYFRGIVTWYQTIGLGVSGGEIDEAVTAALAEGGLRPALNPGHLTGLDEWVHSPIFPGSTIAIASGMPFQCDIIPVPMPPGRAANCEDPVIFADEALREALREQYPAVWERIAARQEFMRDGLGIAIGDEVLPLSTMPAYFPPLWLSPARVLIVS